LSVSFQVAVDVFVKDQYHQDQQNHDEDDAQNHGVRIRYFTEPLARPHHLPAVTLQRTRPYPADKKAICLSFAPSRTEHLNSSNRTLTVPKASSDKAFSVVPANNLI
jgi:hypothetical protein